ncbi:4-hydroxyphenylpyruvate dioxygenase [Pseudonocardia eucalypti]|uniref:4-hydroxyphenylpyruvate dioxygenase n=1 Tax=Pseudonocardia eucalypti TaxID=648755 RepID=A0ABP9RD50_9PSEU|nr:4-hydroxymandelate synthase [Pseudonocardia eucalypti]
MNGAIRCDHVQFYVEDLCATAEELTAAYGFVELLAEPSGGTAARSVVLGQGSIVVALTEPGAAGPGRDFLDAHGDGLARIGFSCTDLRSVYARAVAGGARVIEPPRRFRPVWMAAVGGVGDVVHTLVEQPPDTPTVFLPGIGSVPRGPVHAELGLQEIDHFAICVPPGELARVAAHYQLAWGFERIFAERIEVGAQAMDSVVVASRDRGAVFTLIEPAGAQPGQIDYFLGRHGGAGVQHMALRTNDIVATVGALAARGVKFGHTPAAYYAELPNRLARTRHELLRLRRLGVLADRDHNGDLYQIFAQSGHPRGTYFTEIVERDGATTFGANNVKALFEAKQRELDQDSDVRSVS